jgi:hypothetical protein
MRRLITILLVLLTTFSRGQNVCSLSPEYVNTVFCLSGYSNYNDNINASIVVEDILAKINLKNTYFVTKVCKGINNAVAIKYNGVKYILLDVNWMESLKYGKNDWFHLFVIGHEMGHHLLKHTEKETTLLQESRKNELAADEFGGYILGMYGASLDDINSLLINFSVDNNKNSTHPSKNEREIAVKKGFNSSKKNETSALIQSLTKGVSFDLTSLPYLLNSARNKFNSYLETNDKNILSQAIESYQEAIRFSNDPQIAYELGALFLSKGETDKYNSALELAYQKTKDEKFILELIGSLIENEDKNTDKLLLKYATITKTISYEKYYEPNCLKAIIDYFMYMSRRNYDVNGINFDNLNIAETFCKNILTDYVSKSEDMEILHNRAEIYNALGLCALWRENYDLSYKYFNNAKTDFESAKIYDTQLENIFCYYSMNLLVVHYNIALSSIRLREWQNGLDAITNYENLFTNLSKEKQEYIVTRKNEISYQTNYLKGRCYHGLEQYEKAIIFFTNAIKFENSAFYLYYYRGISYLGVNNSYLACKDFKFACDNGFKGGCNRYINCN